MIIWGSRGLTLKGASGEFYCPGCKDGRPYQVEKVQRFFTLYFIPLIPLDVVHQSVKCLTCRQSWVMDVLRHDPRADQLEAQREFDDCARTIFSHFARMSGRRDAAFLSSVGEAYKTFTTQPLDNETILSDWDQPRVDVVHEAQRLGRHLNEHGREVLVTSAMAVATADGSLSGDKQHALSELGLGIGMSEAHLRGVLSGWNPAQLAAPQAAVN